MKFLNNLFKKEKKKTREELLLEDYEKGKYLQIDNQINNKEYFKSFENGSE
jgi:putative cell wall-binding protein